MQTGLAAGTTVGGLTVEVVLGQGASGTVYRARDRAGGPVALKVLDPVLAADRRFRERFLREAALAGTLEHPSVVPVVATGEDDGLLYIAMAYVDGVDLRTLLRDEGPLPPDRALALLAGIAGALDAAHAAGLVHRDVTPGNVLVGRLDGREGSYLADFGLARHASTPTSLTGERSFVGTIDYIAPEQIRGDPLDGAADQYALACVLFACLTGAPPFVRETDVATVFAHLNERPPTVSSLAPELPPALDPVLARGLAKEPGARHADCRTLIAAAEAAQHGPPAGRHRVRTAVVAGAAALVALGAGRRRSPCGRRQRPRPRHVRRRAERVRAEPARANRCGDGHGAADDGRPEAPPLLHLDAGGVALLDVAERRVVAQTTLPGVVADVAVVAGAPWALLPEASRLVRLDPSTGDVESSVDLPFAPGSWPPRVPPCGSPRTAGRGSCGWTRPAVASARGCPSTSARGGRRPRRRRRVAVARAWWAVLRVDPASGRVVHRFRTPLDADRLAFGGGALWVASSGDGQLFEIDAATNAIVARPKLHGYVTDLAVADGSAWVTVTPEDLVYRLNPDDGSVQGAAARRAGAGERRGGRRRARRRERPRGRRCRGSTSRAARASP